MTNKCRASELSLRNQERRERIGNQTTEARVELHDGGSLSEATESRPKNEGTGSRPKERGDEELVEGRGDRVLAKHRD
jgi:hypothetical protein